jgi:heme/copper-type cytochrome/quinol oxidase subunit 2
MYLVSFVTLLIFTASLISLLQIGLQAWVFTEAEPIGYQVPPPTLYIEGSLAKPVAEPTVVTLCSEDGGCAITAEQKQQIGDWREDYQRWQADRGSNRQRAQALVNAFSFLIIAGAVFFFHWRLADYDRQREDGSPLMVRAIYLWAFSFIWLITLIVSGGFFVNSLLKQAIPSAREEAATTREMTPLFERNSIDQITVCADKCQFDAETIALAGSWSDDYNDWNNEQRGRSPFANNMAVTIPFVLISAPLFWYHFRKVRRENRHEPDNNDKVEH